MINQATGLVDWHVDLFYDDKWNEVTEDVNVTNGLQITRGRSDYESEISPSQASFMLDNTSGKYSPKNPVSPLYGKLGRNQPVRVRVGEPESTGFIFAGLSGSSLTTPADASANLNQDFQVAVDIEPETWFPETEQIIAYSMTDDGGFGWALLLHPDGEIRFARSLPDGSNQVTFIPHDYGSPWGDRKVFSAWYWYDSVDNVQRYRLQAQDSLDRPWPEEGYASSRSGDETTNDASAGFSLGSSPDGNEPFGSSSFRGAIHGFVVADYSDQENPVTRLYMTPPVSQSPRSFTDSTGYAWTSTGVDVGDNSARFVGEVHAWPPRWGQPDGADAEVSVEAFGIRRRLDRSGKTLRSPIRRAMLNEGPAALTLAYWPMEDRKNASDFASAVGDYAMVFGDIPGYHIRDIELAADDGFISSEPLPKFHITAGYGRVAPSEPTGEYRLSCLLRLPADGIPTNEDGTEAIVDFLTLHMAGEISEWTLQANSTNENVRWKRVRSSDGAIGYTSWFQGPSHGDTHLMGMWIRTSGADAEYQYFVWDPVADTFNVMDNTRTSTDLGYPIAVTVGNTGDLGGTTIGHVSLWNNNTNDTKALFGTVPHAFEGNIPETTTERVVRVAEEEDIPLAVMASPVSPEGVGPQTIDTALSLLDEATAADMAILSDTRMYAGLTYRPRGALYNQTPVTLDYAAGHVISPFEPTDDDEPIRNDVTMSRDDGGSFRAVKESGPLSVAPPPEGIGFYEHSETFNFADDNQLANQAAWRLHLGTIDEVRYPSLTVSLNGSPDIVDTVLPLDIGDRVVVENLPEWLPPNTADLIVQGYTEHSDGLEWTITYNCTPASAWSVGVADDAVRGRADTAGSEVVYDVDAAETVLPVLTTDGPRWIQASDRDGQFPFDVTVGGEIVSVNSISSLLSDDFARGDAGIWDSSVHGLWDDTFIWSP